MLLTLIRTVWIWNSLKLILLTKLLSDFEGLKLLNLRQFFSRQKQVLSLVLLELLIFVFRFYNIWKESWLVVYRRLRGQTMFHLELIAVYYTCLPLSGTASPSLKPFQKYPFCRTTLDHLLLLSIILIEKISLNVPKHFFFRTVVLFLII